MTRERALYLVREENLPRYFAIKSCVDLVGLDCRETLTVIDHIPTLYGTGGV